MSQPPAIMDCWNRIGVKGDSSCQELHRHVHCRNCPVYSKESKKLLDKIPPKGLREEWTRVYASARKSAAASAESMLVFRLGAEWLGLRTAVCREVAEVRPVHSIPHRPEGALLGVVNVRGRLLMCVSLSRLLGLAERTERREGPGGGGKARMVVAEHKAGATVFPVDEAAGVRRFAAAELRDPPETLGKSAHPSFRGLVPVDGRQVGLLNESQLFESINRSLG